MTDRDAIENLKNYIESLMEDYGYYKDIVEFRDSVEHLEKTIKTQQEEIEKYKIQLAEVFANTVNSDLKQKHKHEEDLEALHLGWKAELEKKDKIINELAKLIYEDDGSWNMHNKFNEQEIIKYVTEKVE